MQKRLTISFLMLLTLAINAQEVSREHITETARAFVQGYLGSSSHEVSGIRELARTDGNEIYIIDLDPGGWLLMSHDYSALPVLAFSLTGSYVAPPEDEYDNRNAFLGEYIRQLKSAVIRKSSVPDPRWDPAYYYMKSSAATADVTVQPIIKVTWNQGSGWNRFCPADADGPGGHVYAGCVAVSMAQAMSVYGVPVHGLGEKQYDHPDYGSIYANFGAATYDWANMKAAVPDDYNALILFHCAVSVDMDFSPEGSGTLTSAAASTALKEFFYYSKKIAFTKRVANTDDWKALLDKNLVAGRPIIYSGFPPTSNIGHAFNVDGVFKSNYYHLNWGWTGINDGYYTIDNLKPGTLDYTANQSAILGIQPYYYPTDVALSDTLVLLSNPSGKAIGKYSVIDEATDNSYDISLECDSTLIGSDWVPDYYLDGDTLRAARVFERVDGPIDTVTFIVNDAHGNSIRATRLLLLTASLSADDGEEDDQFTVFPVPVTDHLVVTVPPGTVRITVRDIRGTEVISTAVSSGRETLQASGLRPGIYIVTITTLRGRQYSRTIVKN